MTAAMQSLSSSSPVPTPIAAATASPGASSLSSSASVASGASSRASSDTAPATIVDRLDELARTRPDDTALVMLDDGGVDGQDRPVRYADLARRARAVAAALQETGLPVGARVLLALEGTDDYLVAFLGCQYAGVIAVPVFPPEPARPHHLERFGAIARDAGAAAVLAARADIEGRAFAGIGALGAARLLAVDDISAERADAWRPHRAGPADIAFLQYTSGSTSAPKGVMVSHGNLMANEIAIQATLGTTAEDVYVTWLPPFHDMGLIGGLLQPLHAGGMLVLMTTAAFLARPTRWLDAMHRYRGTVAAGPDFAYRLCADRAARAGRDAPPAWDLSAWRIALSGAEPVRADTVADFQAAFAPCGFAARAVTPSYGLAEATLLVTGGQRTHGEVSRRFSSEALKRGIAAPLADDAATPESGAAAADVAAQRLVGCGAVARDHALRIVDPSSGAARGAGEVGEIQVKGPSVALGYWGRPEASAETFVEEGPDRWLRTGDLGFLLDGELYVTGRIKDLIIVRGHNLYPQDIEAALESRLDLVRKGRIAAFAVPGPTGDAIGVAAEVSRATRKAVRPQALVAAIAAVVGEVCGEAPRVTVLLNPGGLPKTSSGKIQRSAARRGWQDGSLDAYAVHAHGRFVVDEEGADERTSVALDAASDAASHAASDAEPDGDANPARHAVPGAPRDAALNDTERALAAIWHEVLDDAGDLHLTPKSHFFAVGGNSLTAVRLASRVTARFGASLAVRDLFRAPTLAELAARVQALRQDAGKAPPSAALVPIARGATMPLSPTQRRLWLVERLTPRAERQAHPAYNMTAALHLSGPLDLPALRAAMADLIERHEVLRTGYPENDDGEPVALLRPPFVLELPLTDLSALPAARQPAALDEAFAAMAGNAFELADGPLLRAMLLRLAPERHALLLGVHHIVFDGWSVAVFVRDLATAYAARQVGRPPSWSPLPVQYADYADWQTRQLAAALPALAAHWREVLRGAPVLSTLPPDRERPAVASMAGDAFALMLPRAEADAIAQLARAQGSTPFAVMLAAFLAALHRRAASDDLVIGTDVAGRDRPEIEDLIGFFVNVVPLRSRQERGDSFVQWLSRVRDLSLSAFEHAAMPFDQIVDAAGVPRTRRHGPLVQTLFVVQNTPAVRPDLPGLGMRLESRPPATSKFDLAVFVTDTPDGLHAEWVFAAALYERASVAAFAQAWRTLLRAAVATPEAALDALLDTATDAVPGGLLPASPPPFKEPTMSSLPMPAADKLDKLSKLNKLSKLGKGPAAPAAGVGAPAMAALAAVRLSTLAEDRRFPLIVEATSPDLDPVAWARRHRDAIESLLLSHGGLLMRGFGLRTPQEFEAFAETIEPELFGGYGDLPKKEGGRNTYRSTPYPERQMILFHNESAHLERWPRKQWFFCELPSPVGGATPIVDCREMLRRLPAELVDEFERKGLLYVRTFTPRLDVSWQDFFKTTDRAEVEARLMRAGTGFRWLDDDTLQTRTRCPAVVKHPLTGERVFFNQVQLHHVSCLEAEVREDLLGLVGPDRMPRHVMFGDGSLIPDTTMAVVGATYEACAVRLAWRQGDVIMLDNMLAAHARDPYEGPRKIVVAMGAMFDRAALGGEG